jgi:hypothetical protein
MKLFSLLSVCALMFASGCCCGGGYPGGACGYSPCGPAGCSPTGYAGPTYGTAQVISPTTATASAPVIYGANYQPMAFAAAPALKTY